jgi:hypothetical protein
MLDSSPGDVRDEPPNAALAYQVLDLIKAHPKNFDMGVWTNRMSPIQFADLAVSEPSCGTQACFAGWTVAIKGYRLDGGGRVFDESGKVVSTEISRFAGDLLNLDAYEVDELFYVDDEEIEDAVRKIFGPRPDSDR